MVSETLAKGSGALILALSLLLALPGTAPANDPALERVEDYGVALLSYATVARSDDSYRRMLISPEALAAAEANAPLPDGTRILMETYYSPGTVSIVFHMRKQEGEWRYGSFTPSSPDLSVAPRSSCHSCHQQAAASDYVFTVPSLSAVARGGPASTFVCPLGGRTPCPAEVYRDGAISGR